MVPNHWTTSFCETNGIRIRYMRTGGDMPSLVLLHGLTGSGACWKTTAQMLEREYDIIMPDARGHGRSDMPDHGYRYQDHAADVVGLIQALRLHSPVLLGHSMGGMTAAVVANHHPELLSGLVLADPTFLDAKTQREVFDSDVKEQHRQMPGSTLDELVVALQSRHPNRLPEIIELIAAARLQTSMAAFDVLVPPNPDYEQLMRGIDIPCMLVLGDKGVMSPSAATKLRCLNPRLRTERIPNAGHGLHYDQPERFAEIVRSFIYSFVKT
jgi:pimeloyl-ACP methyl ester carboxylesterase